MRATKIIGHIKSMSYIERLKHLNLPTLKNTEDYVVIWSKLIK